MKYEDFTVEEKEEMEAIWSRQKDGYDNIVCPGCDYEWEDGGDWGDEGTYTCDECGAEFEYTAEYSVSYDTKLVSDVKRQQEIYDQVRKRVKLML